MNLPFDIETIPTGDPAIVAEIAAGITPPGNYKKPESIAEWEATVKPGLVDEAVRKTALDGAYGRIVCIGAALNDSEPITFCGMSEAGVISAFFQWVQETTGGKIPNWIGHNVGWDIRFLWKRSLVLGIKVPLVFRGAVNAKPWTLSDTMLMWDSDRDKRISLDKLCRLLGIPSPKLECDGSKVYDLYKSGDFEAIATYCKGDVIATRECYKRMA